MYVCPSLVQDTRPSSIIFRPTTTESMAHSAPSHVSTELWPMLQRSRVPRGSGINSADRHVGKEFMPVVARRSMMLVSPKPPNTPFLLGSKISPTFQPSIVNRRPYVSSVTLARMRRRHSSRPSGETSLNAFMLAEEQAPLAALCWLGRIVA